MHYKFLSEVGEHYETETTTAIMVTMRTSLRKHALLALATQLLQARTHYEQCLSARGIHGKGVGSTIQARIATYQQSLGTASTTVTEQMLIAAKGTYEGKLRHFQNQGGVTTLDGKLDWGASDRLVVYDATAAEQKMTQLRIINGLFYTDDAGMKPFDTSTSSTFHSGLGFVIYVMSEEGHIHAANHSIGHRHHSSLLAAASTAGAGELKVTNGRLMWISNKSGHYFPGNAHFVQTLHQLQKENVNLDAVRVEHHPPKTTYASVGDFLAALKPEEDYYHAKMIGYINSYPYGQVEALVDTNNWRFPSAPEYHNQGKKGILDKTTGAPVAYKMACQFFKAQGYVCDPMVNPSLLQKGTGR
ncbi:hypothetical protein [Paludibaculum fermentans]|uniref:hypothetical protein n=1 Tax=Paludibaculum fermentans TaxID=1473598 RepID=UPI003EBD6A15